MGVGYFQSSIMKIAAIGDPHGNLEKIQSIRLEKIDLALLTGDLGQTDNLRKLAYEFLNIKRPGPQEKNSYSAGFKQAFLQSHETAIRLAGYIAGFCPVYVVRGNADISNYDTRKFARTFGIDLPYLYQDLLKIKGLRLIDNRLAVFRGVRIGGVKYFTDICWAREFELDSLPKIREIALRDTQNANRVLERFGKLDILVTHVPPYGVLDRVESKTIPASWVGRHAGSRAILEYIQRQQPAYVFCGHIHESEGFEKIGRSQVYNLGAGGHRIIELEPAGTI
jgi:Icc-related predicted phosphoesterase